MCNVPKMKTVLFAKVYLASQFNDARN